MKFTGHADYDSMNPNVAIVDNLKKQSMAKIDSLFPTNSQVFSQNTAKERTKTDNIQNHDGDS